MLLAELRGTSDVDHHDCRNLTAPTDDAGPGSRPPEPRSRRSFLLASGAVVAAAGTGAAVATVVRSAGRTSSATHPIRPPAVPLVVRGPYVSTWLPSTVLPGTWPVFWDGRRTQLTGIVRVDGTSYVFAGAPAGPGRMLRQSLLETTPTRSRFYLEGGGIRLTAEFLSPVEPGHLRAQSIPLSYVLLTVRSADGKPHHVQIYMDISGEWQAAPTRTRSGGRRRGSPLRRATCACGPYSRAGRSR